MARRGKACVYTYWKTLGRRIGRLSKNTRRPFEKPPRHNLLSPFSPPPSPIESPIHDCARNLDQGPSCRCLPTRNSDIATQRFALTLFTQRAPFPPHHRWAYVCVCVCAMQRPGACVPDANACAPAKARAGRKHRVDTRERARGLMDDRFCV